ncbi:hypothetical protein GCM10028818_52270 [Spirosoma horti]
MIDYPDTACAKPQLNEHLVTMACLFVAHVFNPFTLLAAKARRIGSSLTDRSAICLAIQHSLIHSTTFISQDKELHNRLKANT